MNPAIRVQISVEPEVLFGTTLSTLYVAVTPFNVDGTGACSNVAYAEELFRNSFHCSCLAMFKARLFGSKRSIDSARARTGDLVRVRHT